MDALFWGLIAMAITWFPAGYLVSRWTHASGFGHDLIIHHLDMHYGYCECESASLLAWNRPIKTGSGRVGFVIGTLLGWITSVIIVFLFVFAIIYWGFLWLITR